MNEGMTIDQYHVMSLDQLRQIKIIFSEII